MKPRQCQIFLVKQLSWQLSHLYPCMTVTAIPTSRHIQYLGVFNYSLTYQPHLEHLKMKISSHTSLIQKLLETLWTADPSLYICIGLGVCCSWILLCNMGAQATLLVDTELNLAIYIISGWVNYSLTSRLYMLEHIALTDPWWDAITVNFAWKAVTD